MKNSFFKYLFLVSTIFFIVFPAFSQDKIADLEKQLAITRNSIKNVQNISEQVYNKLKLINAEIKLQKEILVNVQKKISFLEGNISENKIKVNRLKREISILNKEYEELIFYAYKTRDMRDKTVFILSARSFNQAYRRFTYLRYYTEYIEQTTEKLTLKKDSLLSLNSSLSIEYNQTLALKEKESDIILDLNNQYAEQQKLRKTLLYKKSELEAQLKTKEIAAKALRNSVETQILSNFDTKSEATINFEKFKGKYSMPASGTITGFFGIQKHPVLENVQVMNDGIEISVNGSSNVKVIADGIVSKVVSIPGANKAVIVKHGDYFTVYSNLSEISVKTGQSLTKNSAIGKIFISPSSSISGVLNFQIWYKRTKLDPKDWLN